MKGRRIVCLYIAFAMYDKFADEGNGWVWQRGAKLSSG